MHITVLSLGAGVQSSAMALMAAKGQLLKEDGTPYKVDCAIFADTGHEPRHTKIQHPDGYWIEGGVYGWLDWLEQQVDYPIYRVSAGDLAADSLLLKTAKKGNVYMENHIPAFLVDEKGKGLYGRQCTANYKIRPMYSFLREMLGVKRVSKQSPHQIDMLIGISVDEISRMKPSRAHWVNNLHPLIDMNYSREECKAWMVQNGYPIPKRSACTFCPFHSNKEWIELKNESPEDFASAVSFEKDLQFFFQYQDSFAQGSMPYLHASGIPLDQIEFNESDVNEVVDAFGNECEGLCGV